MKNYLRIISILAIMLVSASCTAPGTNSGGRGKPHYVGVDRAAQPYVDEYMELSKQNNIAFTHSVSLGFTSIDREVAAGRAIGVCYYEKDFREIDLDVNFFTASSELRRKALVFHELTHCYCNRSHDFAENQEYSPNLIFRIVEIVVPWGIARTLSGYLDDGCPMTIMHPVILSEQCLNNHWDYYKKEMFARCDPF